MALLTLVHEFFSLGPLNVNSIRNNFDLPKNITIDVDIMISGKKIVDFFSHFPVLITGLGTPFSQNKNNGRVLSVIRNHIT